MSMQLSVKIDGLNELIRDMRNAGGDAKPLVTAALTNSATEVQSQARRRAPHRTGTLQRSIMTEIRYPSAEISVGEKYGIYHEMGTGIYGPNRKPITPKSARVLAFSSGGRTVFARSVKGVPARPFFIPGYEASKSYIDDQFNKVMDIILRNLAGRGR